MTTEELCRRLCVRNLDQAWREVISPAIDLMDNVSQLDDHEDLAREATRILGRIGLEGWA